MVDLGVLEQAAHETEPCAAVWTRKGAAGIVGSEGFAVVAFEGCVVHRSDVGARGAAPGFEVEDYIGDGDELLRAAVAGDGFWDVDLDMLLGLR